MAVERQAGFSSWADPASVTLASAPVEGNLLVAVCSERSGSNTSTFALTSITGWTAGPEVNAELADGTYRRSTKIFWKVAGASESSTCTFDNATTNKKLLTLCEFEHEAGEDQWSLLTSGSDNNGATANATSDTVTMDASSSGDQYFIAAMAVKRGGASNNTDGSWATETLVEVNEGGNYTNGMYHHVAAEDFTATGTKASTCTISGYTTNNGLNILGLVFDIVASSGTTLVISDCSHGHTADNLALTQAHSLAVADSSHAHTADNLTLAQVHALNIAEALHGHTADNLSLTQAHALNIAEALHGHTADNIALTQAHALSVDDALSAHSADNIDLTQAQTLSIDESSHSQSADNISLSGASTLAIQDSSHSHVADNLDLVQVHVLDINESGHATVSDNLTLTAQGALNIASAIHGLSSDNIDLSQAQTLVIDEASHGVSSDNITLSLNVVLDIADAQHSHAVDNLTLSQNYQLQIDDALIALQSSNIDLTQAHTLVISDALHAHFADQCNVFDPTTIAGVPTRRLLVVDDNGRLLVIAKSNRSLTVH